MSATSTPRPAQYIHSRAPSWSIIKQRYSNIHNNRDDANNKFHLRRDVPLESQSVEVCLKNQSSSDTSSSECAAYEHKRRTSIKSQPSRKTSRVSYPVRQDSGNHVNRGLRWTTTTTKDVEIIGHPIYIPLDWIEREEYEPPCFPVGQCSANVGQTG